MIESDINEQMASFSPTQNVNAGIDRDVDAIAADMASKRQLLPDPMLPKENAVPDIDPDAAVIAARRNNELMASMMAASQTNPVEAAKALKLGEKFGVGTDMALRNQADLERMDLMNSVQRRNLMQRDPVLARYLTQRDFAAIAHDDIDNLSATESIFNYVRRIPSRIETGLIQAVDTAERGEIYTRQRAGEFHESDKIVLDAIKTELANLPQDNGFIESAAQFMGIRAEMAPTMFRRAAFGTVAGAAMGGPAGAAIGMGIGLDVGSFEVGAEMEGGNAYGDMKEAGYNDSVAVPASVGVGVINGALELVGGKILTAGYRYAFKSAVSTATREALVRPTTVAALKTLGMHYAKDIAGETATEVAQEIVTIAGDEIARHYGSNLESRLASPEGRKEIADRLVDTALQTAMGMAVIGAGGPAAQFYVDQSRANAASRAQSFFENLNKNVVNSKVRGRNADAYERFIASQAEGTGAETIYVDAQEMANVLRQSALTDQEMDNVLPGLRQQLEQAMSVGGDVTIPTAGFAARVAGTDLGDKMMPHMRLDPSAMSAQQAEQYATQLEQRKAEALAIEAEKETTDTKFVDEARAVEKEALAQLEAAGQDKKLAKLNAQIYRDMVVVMAADPKRNQTPAQIHAEIGPDIFGPQGMQATVAAAPLEQADQFNQAGERRTDTPEFKAWFKESKAVTEQGIPLRLYRGASEKITEPRRMFSGGIFLTPSRELALSYGPEIMEVFASVQNPLDVSDAKTMSMKQWRTYLQRKGVDMQAVRFDSSLGTRYSDPGVDSLAGGADSLGGVIRYNFYELLGENDSWKNDGNLREELQRQGFDGVISQPETGAYVESRQPVWIVWEGNQLKSPDNRGTWSRTTSNIMRQSPPLEQAARMTLADVEQAFTDFGVEQRLTETDIAIRPGIIRVPENIRAEGRATNAMQRLIEYADQVGKRIDVSPTSEFGANKRRLVEWYKRLGFVENKGRNKDFAISATMYRVPKPAAPGVMEQASRIDADYMAAVERGDTAMAQRMVDEAAERSFTESVVRGDGDIGTAGKILRMYHGSGAFIRQFMYEFTGLGVDQLGSGFYFTTDRPEAESYMTRRRDGETVKIGGESQPTVVEAYLDIRNPLRADKVGSITREQVRKFIAAAPEETRREGLENWGIDGDVPSAKVLDAYAFKDANIVRELFKIGNDFYGRNTEAFNRAIKDVLGYDGVVQDFRVDGVKKLHYVAFFPEQIKSANPVTYDEAGNVIPLSRRFDITSPRIFEQAQVPASFYSALGRAIDGIDIKSASAAGWKERIKGLVNKGDIKQDELTWSGLEDWLSLPREGKITKEEVADFLKNNGVRVERVAMGSSPADLLELRNALARAEDAHDAARAREDAADRGNDEAEALAATEAANQTRRAVVRAELALKDAEKTKYAQYTLPGGTNYREVLLTLPVDTEQRRAAQETYNRLVSEGVPLMEAMERAQETLPKEFRSQHWTQPNVVAHLRMNDRVDADGKRVLFVEEVQSDWGQAGRKQGFARGFRPATEDDVRAIMRAVFGQEDGDAELEIMGWETIAPVLNDPENAGDLVEDAGWSEEQVEQFIDLAKQRKVGTGIPIAPFVETTDGWLNLGLKQVLLEAVRGNYDRVAFVSGEQSADRYDLSKQVESIVFNKNMDGTFNYQVTLRDTESDELDGNSKTLEQIEETFGKEIARKMDAATPANTSDATEQEDMFPNELSGLDLKVGGEGMQNFYDKIVPAAMGKLLKKYGGEKLIDIVLPNMRQQEMKADAERMGMNVADVLDLAEDTEYARAQPGFNITQELVKKLESGLPLFQAMPERNEPRGQYDANRIAILLNTKASATTFFHELIHWRMDMAIRMVNQGKASAQEAADVDTLFKSFGIAGDTPQERLATWNKMSIEQQRPHWETVAYNSEIYLFEGKAPSVEMQGVFDRLHAFIKRVYVSIRNDLNALYRKEFGKDLPILTGEVRQVMDRWLASDEQIKRKQAMMQMVPLFLTQEESGMDDATYAAYQQMNKEAEEAAVTDLTKASLRQMQWLSGARSRVLKELQAKHDDLRKKTRAEVMEEVKNEPVYAAMSILKTGEGRAKNGELVKFDDKFKLNLEAVKKMLPEEQVRQLGYGKYGMVAGDGIAPDMVAEMVGFSSGDELVLAILAAKPLKEEVDARTDRRMMEEHGELNTPQAMEEAVQRALHNEARARFNAVEVRWLSKATAPVKVFMDAAKLAAKQIVAGKVIRDLRPSDHQAAEAKAAREAAEAHKSRRTAEQAAKAAETKERNVGLSAAAAGVPMTEVEAAAAAKGQEAAQRVSGREAEYKAKYGDRTPEQVILRAKQIQLLQNQLAQEAQEAKDEVAKAVKDFRKFFKADDKLAKTRNMDLVDATRAILSAFGFGKSDKSPAEYIDKLKAYNAEMYAAIEPLVMAATSGSKNYKDLTVEQFRQLREVVDALWEQSRRDKLVEIDGKMVALADVVGELETRLDEIGVPKVVAGERGAPTTKDRAVRGFYDAKAVMRRVEHWADATDGAKGIGPFTKYIWRPIKDAVNAYRIDRNKYVKKYVELLKQVVLPEGKIESKELDYTFGNANGGIGKAELLGALMHTGNDSNKKKLLVGRGWGSINEDGTLDSSRWDAFVARMIKQGVLTKSDFDFVQATWDLLEEVKPIAQKAHRSIFGFYFKEVEATPFTNEFGTFRGGYVPAKTDAFIVRDAQRQSKMEELEGDFRNSMPSTGMGFTKGRVEYNKPLSMDVRLVTKHIDDVLRFAHVQPAIKDVLRILKNRGFSDKLSRIDPTVVEDMLIPWLNRAARQVTSEPGRNKGMDKFWKAVRSRTGISIMAANLRNAMQQPTGLFPAALKVSKTQLGNALMTYMGSPLKTANEVASLSTFMNERLQSQIFDMQDDINEILLNPNAYNKVVKWTQKHSYFLQSAFQNMVDVVTWTAKYNQVLAESKVGASDTKVQREAIQQADAAVRLTQGSMSAEDISAFEVGTPFYKTFNQFGGYFNMLANLNADEYIKVIRDLGWRGSKGKLLNIYILGFMAPTLIADVIARSMGGGWDDDDDGYLDDVMDWFFGSQARAAVAMVPFGSTAATAITTAFDSKAYNDRISASPSIVALEASTIGVGKTIINIADDDKEIEGKNVRDVLTLISLATGTPVTVLGRPVGYLVDVNRKKIKPTGPIDVARGLVTGVASGESKK